MKMEMELRVFTLNCWGIVGISKDRKERFEGIANILAEGNYDFAFLQEVWSKRDYEMIKAKVAPVMPCSYYFYGGVIGSGCCIFSKGQILDVGALTFSLNGYFYKAQHGDWYGGKGVVFLKVKYNGLVINLYNAHLHAEYCKENDIYLSHRVSQAWQLSQYVNQTQGNCDLSIVGGDFNSMPHDISYKIIKLNSNLSDSYVQRENKNALNEYDGATCGHPRNSYTTKADLKDNPNGQRIDHIFYSFPDGTNVRCLELLTPYDKIPNKPFSVSDHEAVVSHLLVKKSQEAIGYESDQSLRAETLRSSKFIIQTALQHIHFNKLFYILMAVMAVILLAVSSAVFIPYPISIVLIPLRLVFSLLLAFAIYMAVIKNSIERNVMLSVMSGMDTVASIITGTDQFKK